MATYLTKQMPAAPVVKASCVVMRHVGFLPFFTHI